MQDLVHQLLDHHKTVVLTIEDLCDRDLQPGILTTQIVKAIDKLVRILSWTSFSTVSALDANHACVHRVHSVESGTDSKGVGQTHQFQRVIQRRSVTEGCLHCFSHRDMVDLLSIPPKQFLEILAQVQVSLSASNGVCFHCAVVFEDLYQTARSSGTGDDESIKKLYTHAHQCKEIRVRRSADNRFSNDNACFSIVENARRKHEQDHFENRRCGHHELTWSSRSLSVDSVFGRHCL